MRTRSAAEMVEVAESIVAAVVADTGAVVEAGLQAAAAVAAVEVIDTADLGFLEFDTADLGFLGFGWAGGSKNLAERQAEFDFEGTGCEVELAVVCSAVKVAEEHLGEEGLEVLVPEEH